MVGSAGAVVGLLNLVYATVRSTKRNAGVTSLFPVVKYSPFDLHLLLNMLDKYSFRTNRRAPKPEGRESAIPPPVRGQVNEGYWTLRRDDAFVREDEGYAWAAAANVSAFERERPWQVGAP